MVATLQLLIESVSWYCLLLIDRGPRTERCWYLREDRLVVASWVQQVHVLVYAVVLSVPKLEEAVLILDLDFTL